jgi:NADH-quinone oxidoreductase subunit M
VRLGEVSALEQVGFPILSALIVLPLLLAVALLFVPDDRRARQVALGGALVELALSLVVAVRFVPGTADIQFAERVETLATVGSSYHLGVDGISMPFIPITALLTVLVILASWKSVAFLQKPYLMAVLGLEATTMGIFASLDLIQFFVFWELLLVPSYFLLKLWGIGPDRQYTGLRYVMTMLLGSAAMLLGIVLLGIDHRAQTGEFSFDFVDLLATPPQQQTLIFFLLVLGFAVKAPLFPFHAWVSRVLLDGPMGVVVFLAGLKLGVYGFARFVIPLVPEASVQWSWLMAVLGLIGIVYGSVIALVQPNLRRMLAFATVGHAGLAVLGLFSLNAQGLQGGLFMIFNLALSTSGLIFLAAFLHARIGSSELSSYGGVTRHAPALGALFFIIGLAAIGLPGTVGFPGELLSLMGAFRANALFGALGLLGVILSAAYFFRYYGRAFMGPADRTAIKTLPDLRPRELIVAGTLTFLVLIFGFFPGPLFDISSGSVDMLTQRVEAGSAPSAPTAAATGSEQAP